MQNQSTIEISSLSPNEARDLKCLAGLMVPPSAEYAVPGADDDLIFADVLASLGRDVGAVKQALDALGKLAGGSLADLDVVRRREVAAAYRKAGGAGPVLLGRIILQCYYRDDRVLRSLGIDPRPPFPKGHTLEEGDWSILDVVRRRPRLWRDAT